MITFNARKRLAILYTLIGAAGGLPVFISHKNFTYASLALLSLLVLLWIFWNNAWVRRRLFIIVPTAVSVGVLTLYLYSKGSQWLGWIATIAQLIFLLISVAIAWGIYLHLKNKSDG